MARGMFVRFDPARFGATWGCAAPCVQLVCSLLLTSAAIGCACCRNPVGDNVIAARQYSLRGMEAMQRENWDEAESLFARAVSTSPVDERARCRYAETLWRRGARKQAIDQMEEAVRLSSNDPKLLVELGEMHRAEGDLSRAAERAEQAVAANGRLASAWALRGDVLHRTGRATEALACYHRALTYQEHFPRVQLAAANIYRESGRPQRALATLELLAGQYPPGQEPAEVLFHKGLALKSLNRFDDAAEILAAAVKREEATAEMLVHLSDAQLLAGDSTAAGLAVDRALALDPRHAAAQQLRRIIDSRREQMASSLQP
jgi:tetratricopeptide (TPR) repeat protein